MARNTMFKSLRYSSDRKLLTTQLLKTFPLFILFMYELRSMHENTNFEIINTNCTCMSKRLNDPFNLPDNSKKKYAYAVIFELSEFN